MRLMRFFITIPNGVTVPIRRLSSTCFGDALFIDIFDDGVFGANANEIASNFAARFNNGGASNDLVLIDLVLSHSAVATSNNNVVMIEFFADDVCCEHEVFISDDIEPGAGNPIFTGAVSNIQCDEYEYTPINCINYPPRTHIFRFQLEALPGMVFGTFGTDYRYVIDLATGIVPCISASPFQFDSRLSTKNRNSFLEWCNMWAQVLNDYYWAPWYAGSVVHLGGGFFEVTTSIDLINQRTGGDICMDGLGIQCTYIAPIINPGIFDTVFGNFCCIPQPPPPYVDPEFEPVFVPKYEQNLSQLCYNAPDFDCCLYGAGGIDKIYITDWSYYWDNPYDNIAPITPIGIETDLAGKITSLTLIENKWLEICCEAGLTVTQNNNAYNHVLECTKAVMSAGNRLMIEYLRTSRLLIIVKDMNGRYWFLGENAPMRTFEINCTTGGDDSLNSFTISGTQFCICREIYQSVIDTLNLTNSNNCDNYIGVPMSPLSLWEVRNCFLYDLRNNFLA